MGKLELPNTVCCVRTRKDSRWCDLPQGAPSGRGRRRVYSDQMWTPKEKWQQRTGWQRVSLVVRGREVHLRVKVEGPCRRVGWGERVFFLIVVRGHHKRTKRGKSRADGVLGARGVGRRGRVAVACVVEGVVVEGVAALGAGSGVSLDEERVWAGGEAMLGGGQRGAERGVACVGVWGVGVERVLCVGRVSGSCAVDCSGCVVECAE